MHRRFRLALAIVALPALASCATTPPAPMTQHQQEPAAPPADPAPEHVLALSAEEAALTPEQVLGKRLFEDENLSEPHGQSCKSCHDPLKAFTGDAGSTVAGVAAGAVPGVVGNRNVPTAMYLATSPSFSFVGEPNDTGGIDYTPTGGFFWDGRAASLSEQAKGPFLNPREMNNPSQAAVITKVRNATYASLFRRVYGDRALDDVGKAYDKLAQAIAAFEGSPLFSPFSSKFDDYLRGKASLTAQEAKGFALFKNPDKGNCMGCHAGDPKSRKPQDWLFTDFTYDNLGVPRNQAIPDNQDPAHFDPGLAGQAGLAAKLPAGVDPARLVGAFKVPTLRNIQKTGPYMHNGKFAQLRDVVKFYVTRDTNAGLWYPKDATGKVIKFNDLPTAAKANVNTEEVPYDRKAGEKPRLNDDEIDAVVAFLNTLTDR
ncbi:MAG: cytochrome-c peroxidase [Cyanobacteria bacterium RYN_339]|nr:cytochrome-c peroxidase [Cyanobacteria bacterium RYN_339]